MLLEKLVKNTPASNVSKFVLRLLIAYLDIDIQHLGEVLMCHLEKEGIASDSGRVDEDIGWS